MTVLWYKSLLVLTYLSIVVSSNSSTFFEILDLDDCFSSSSGTNQNFEEIFTGRCFQFQFAEAKSPLCPSKPVSCSALWKYFSEAWAYIDPCAVDSDSYQRYLRQLPFKIPENGSVFWSGTYDIAHKLSELYGLATLEDTMAGYLVNGLQWCGSVYDSSGINYKSCPVYDPNTCNDQTQGVFWRSSSVFFASGAKGNVFVILNGSLPNGAFRSDSIFAQFELPNLRQKYVDRIVIVLVHTLGGDYRESCHNGTLVTLQNEIALRGFDWSCVQDPIETQYLQCALQPTDPSCPPKQVQKRLFNNV